MESCCVPCCNVKNAKLYPFPNKDTLESYLVSNLIEKKTPEIKKKKQCYRIWIYRAGLSSILGEKKYECLKMCRDHFSPCCFTKPSNHLKPGSLPTIAVPHFKNMPYSIESWIHLLKNRLGIYFF